MAGVTRSLRALLRRPWVRYGLGLVLILFLLSLLDLRAMADTLLDARPGYLALAVATGVGLMAFSGYRWSRLVDPALGVGTMVFVRLTFVSAFAGLFLPGTIGTEAMRVLGLSRATGGVVAVSSVLADRVLSLLAQVVLALLAVALLPSALRDDLVLWGAGGLLAIVAGVGAVMHRGLRRGVLRAMSRFDRPHLLVGRAFEALDTFRNRRMMAWAFVLALLLQVFRAVFLWTCALTFDADIAVWHFLIALPLVSLVELVPITFAGVGTRDAAFAVVLAQFGIPPETSVPVSLLAFVLGSVVASLPGAWLWMTLPSRDA
ncbi:lysylphosphatidylglycerol synthase transmembrane domain-containing protein [Jannaschia rubra]|uniref:lysylphosphatidylglycerol synthase transmembrane domain-containing protein n=1 Tax=Jannaschia rubra TaxID=282197 RepID=UPI0024924F55|nr:lysylphosphatidylglycerol synthase transmembrane domain-containing protein [Jannaschia rubra]